MTMETKEVRKYKHKHPANGEGDEICATVLSAAEKEVVIEFDEKMTDYKKTRKDIMSNELEMGMSIKAEDGNNPNKQNDMEHGE